MNDLLEKAFHEASKLPPDEQQALASWLVEELRSERTWQKAFSDSSDELGRLADEARQEHRAGNTPELDPGSL